MKNSLRRWWHDHFGHCYHLNTVGLVAINGQRPVFQCSCGATWLAVMRWKPYAAHHRTPTRNDTFVRYAA